MKRNFLVVGSNAQVREALAGELRAMGYTVTRAANGSEAKRVVGTVSFDSVLIESHLPDVSPDELREQLQQIRPDCRVVILTSFDLVRNSPEQLQFGSDDYLVSSGQIFDLLRAQYDGAADGEGSSIANRGHKALTGVIDVLVGLLEVDDRYFGGSSHRAMDLAREVAEALSSDEETVQEVTLACLLRDIGKAGVAPDVFSEPGPLSPEQRKQMEEHVGTSLQLFEHIDFPWKVLPIIRHHHERYDGSGYPDGLKGREIPMGARIVAIVDSYVALTSQRRHREALQPERALQKLVRHAGRQFDPEVVEAFQTVLDKRLATRRTEQVPHVLIVDPQEDFRRMLRMRLLNEGHEVQEAATYDVAMKHLLKKAPDLILVNIDSHSGEAFQLLGEIRDSKQLCRTPFAFLAHGRDRVLRSRALRQGVDDFLSKNEDIDELVARVQNILTRESIRREGGSRRIRRGITGDLEHLGLPDIVQTLAMGMKTACVTVSSNGNSGKVWFLNGGVKHAKAGESEGDAAFYEMVRWQTGEFVIEHGVTRQAEHDLPGRDVPADGRPATDGRGSELVPRGVVARAAPLATAPSLFVG